MIRFLLFLILILCAGAPASQHGAPPLIFTEIDLAEPVSSVQFADVDGDGLQDAILLIDRRVEVHKLSANGSFNRSADITIKLPWNAVAIDAAALDPPETTRARPKSQLIVLAGAEILTHPLDAAGGAFTTLSIPPLADPLAPRAAGAPPIAMMLHADFDLDGVQELLVPTGGGVAILKHTKDGFITLGTAGEGVDVAIDPGQQRPGSLLKQTFELPRVSVVDVKNTTGGQERLLSISRENDAWIYQIREKELFLLEHARGLYNFDRQDRFREARGTRRNEDTNDRAVGLFASDLNGDGIPDFVSSRFRDGQVFITFGKPGKFGAETPDRSLDVDGWAVLAQARDFDGDGRPDLIVPRLPKLGIGGALRALLSRKVTIDLWVYKNTGDARVLNDSPDWKHSIDLDILLDGDEGKINVSARLLTNFLDVNADGLADFVTLSAADELSAYPGDRKQFINETPIYKFKIPSISPWAEVDMRAADVNGDKREDFVIVYGPNKKGSKNKILFGVWKS